MTEGQWLLTHLANTTKWVQEKRDYAIANYTEEVPFHASEDMVTAEIHNNRIVTPMFRNEEGTFFIDLRLQYHDEELIKHSGLSDYDQDHHGVWSSSAVEWCNTDEECADIALDLLKDLYNEISED